MAFDKCPLCKKEGESVTLTTVESLVKGYFRKHLKSFEYGFCTNPRCNVVYYNNDKDEIYFQRDLTVSVWLKEQDNPIICYCKGLTMKDIVEEIVINETSENLQDILTRTGAMKGVHCKTHNPSGKCCKESLEAAVEYAISLRESNKL